MTDLSSGPGKFSNFMLQTTAIMKFSYFSIVLFIALSIQAEAKKYVAGNVQEIDRLAEKLLPGDTILLSNGNWNDAQLTLFKSGIKGAMIVYVAETPGKVVFSGNSKVRIGGSYIELNGIVFTNGFSKKGPAIEFRASADLPASFSRVTNCVIDNYNNINRLADDNWVALYGHKNRFDHNYIAHKKNVGTTLIIELNDLRNQENEHRVDHNYFGERPRLGSNGGETIRVGNSTFSRTSSKTIIEDNYFERCDGEVEIVSVKSCDNILRRNTFYECEGALVLRHGDRNIVSDNFFIGNNKPYTGGVRVINAGHKVFNNFFYRLAGEQFRSALTVMNGVPNSPINRYDPVKDVVIANNIFVECNSIALGAGKDLERTAAPENVLIAGNVFYNNKAELFTIYEDIKGVEFSGNICSHTLAGIPANGSAQAPIQVKKVNSTWTIINGATNREAAYTINLQKQLPAPGEKRPVSFTPFATARNTGVNWYNMNAVTALPAGKSIMVKPGENTLYEAALMAKAGDTLSLQPGTYALSKTIEVKNPLTISYEKRSASKPLIQFVGEKGGFTFFSIENGGKLSLQNFRMNGLSKNGSAESFVRTSLQPMIEHFQLYVDGCDFEDITDGRKHALKVNKGSFADTIQFTNCSFSSISGDVISISAEREDKGLYNAEYVVFKNCLFNKVLMGAIDVYRGGNDESTTGPFFVMDHCTFNEVANVELGYVVRLIGVQYSNITNSIFYNSGRAGRIIKYEDYGWTKNTINYCDAFIAGRIESFYPNIVGEQMLNVDPQFVDISNENFQLKPTSPLLAKGNDNRDMGCIWKNGLLTNK